MSVFASIYTLHVINLRRGNECSLGISIDISQGKQVPSDSYSLGNSPQLSLLGIFPSQYEIGKTALNAVPAAWLTP